jgi:hypothetical protein
LLRWTGRRSGCSLITPRGFHPSRRATGRFSLAGWAPTAAPGRLLSPRQGYRLAPLIHSHWSCCHRGRSSDQGIPSAPASRRTARQVATSRSTFIVSASSSPAPRSDQPVASWRFERMDAQGPTPHAPPGTPPVWPPDPSRLCHVKQP